MNTLKLFAILLLTSLLLSAGPAFAAETIKFTVPVTLKNIPETTGGARINGAQVKCTVSNKKTRLDIGSGNDKWTFSGAYKGDRIVPVKVTGTYRKGHNLKYHCELQFCSAIGRLFTCTDNFDAGRSKRVSGRISMKR